MGVYGLQFLFVCLLVVSACKDGGFLGDGDQKSRGFNSAGNNQDPTYGPDGNNNGLNPNGSNQSGNPDNQSGFNNPTGGLNGGGAVLQACAAGVKQTSQPIPVSFAPMQSGCAWGAQGNAARGSPTPAARSEQIVSRTLPAEYRQVCAIRLASRTNSIQYDDSLTFTINGLVVAANGFSFNHLNSSLAKNPFGLLMYDFNRLRNRGYQRNHLLRLPDVNAQIPASESSGAFQLQVSENWFDKAALFPTGNGPKQLNFGISVTGNEQNTDCNVTPIAFDLVVDYIR